MSGDKGGGGKVIMKNVTNGDIGGRGFENLEFCGDIIFEWPLPGHPKDKFVIVALENCKKSVVKRSIAKPILL